MVKRKKIQDGCLSNLKSYLVGSVPLELWFDQSISEVMSWDNVNDDWLDPKMVKTQKQKEAKWLHANEAYLRKFQGICGGSTRIKEMRQRQTTPTTVKKVEERM